MQQTPNFGHRLAFGSTAQAAACQARSMHDALDPSTTPRVSHELFFASLFDSGRALSFPCDHRGVVQLDELSERARNNYFFARSTVGRDYALPVVITLENGSRH
ncbi:MAG: hypothetical protein JWQ76_4825 [Ramlibacter sp.]|nr:hypothetical protein [Ramlibacter sp.]